MSSAYLIQAFDTDGRCIWKDAKLFESLDDAQELVLKLHPTRRTHVVPIARLSRPWMAHPAGIPTLADGDDPLDHIRQAASSRLYLGADRLAGREIAFYLCDRDSELRSLAEGFDAALRGQLFEEIGDSQRVLSLCILLRVGPEIYETWVDPCSQSVLEPLARAVALDIHLFAMGAGLPHLHLMSVAVSNALADLARQARSRLQELAPWSGPDFRAARVKAAQHHLHPWGLWASLGPR